MCEHFVPEDSICNLRSVHQVHFQQASLEMTLFRQVVFQSLEEELRSLLNHALSLEDIGDLQNKRLLALQKVKI